MKTTAFLLAFALSACTLGASDPPASTGVPVLLELFTSEGCSDCPPADRVLESLDREQPVPGADLVVISEHVDYWNHLGWSDPFSSPRFSARQHGYATLFKSDQVYTPQLVVDGQAQLVGSNRANALHAIGQAVREPKIPMEVTSPRSGVIHVAAAQRPGAARRADVFLVLASDHAHSQVGRGENAGASLSHVSVAYAFSKVGAWSTGDALDRDFPVSSKGGATRVIVFLQDPLSGRILGIAHARI